MPPPTTAVLPANRGPRFAQDRLFGAADYDTSEAVPFPNSIRLTYYRDSRATLKFWDDEHHLRSKDFSLRWGHIHVQAFAVPLQAWRQTERRALQVAHRRSRRLPYIPSLVSFRALFQRTAENQAAAARARRDDAERERQRSTSTPRIRKRAPAIPEISAAIFRDCFSLSSANNRA